MMPVSYATPYSESQPYTLLSEICAKDTQKRYIETNNSIILPVAKDNASPKAVPGIYSKGILSVEDTFSLLPPNSSPQKTILIPIAEGHKHLGLIQRKHFVTLMYDPKTNRATLLDSRPWYVSFLYPTNEMKQSLKAGIAKCYGQAKANSLHFETKYQGVQHNDRDCGAWTARNIGDLAGVFGKEPTNIAQQVRRYSARDIGDNPNSRRAYGRDQEITIADRYGTGIILANNLGLPYEPLSSPSLFTRFISWFKKSTNELDRKDASLVEYGSCHVFYRHCDEKEKACAVKHSHAGMRQRNITTQHEEDLKLKEDSNSSGGSLVGRPTGTYAATTAILQENCSSHPTSQQGCAAAPSSISNHEIPKKDPDADKRREEENRWVDAGPRM